MNEISLRSLITKEPRADKIPGGLAKHASVGDLAALHSISLSEVITQLMLGIKVEKEHTADPEIALEIAFDHVYEDPKYYEKLSKIKKY